MALFSLSGVEEAFYNSPRIMTLSFHLHKDGFFPGDDNDDGDDDDDDDDI